MLIGMLKLAISMDLNWVGGMDCQHYRNRCPTWRCESYEMELINFQESIYTSAEKLIKFEESIF
jgi:hypothetical protein